MPRQWIEENLEADPTLDATGFVDSLTYFAAYRNTASVDGVTSAQPVRPAR